MNRGPDGTVACGTEFVDISLTAAQIRECVSSTSGINLSLAFLSFFILIPVVFYFLFI